MESKLQKNNDLAAYAVRLLGILCPLVYFASYLTRKDYAIVMDAIISQEGLNENAAGFVETLGVISYGVGQIISGILGDKFKPQRLIMCGLGITVACNLAMPFTPGAARGAVWFVNGFAQSMLWPPMVRIMAATMNEKTYNTVCANVNVLGITGTIFIYVTSSLLWLRLWGSWKLTFFTSAGLAALILVLWVFGFTKLKDVPALRFEHTGERKTETGRGRLTPRLLLGSGFLLIAVGIVMQGALRDGITDWLPTLMRKTFQIPSNYAILYAVAIPILGVISLKLVAVAANKWVKEELRGAAAVFFAAAALCAALFFCYRHNPYITVALAAVVVGGMHAINFFLVCVVPARFEKYGVVATMSGIINSLTYVGTSLAVTGFPSLTRGEDWGPCIFAWVVIAAAGGAACLFGVRAWKRFKA